MLESSLEGLVQAVLSATLTGAGIGLLVGLALGLFGGIALALLARAMGVPLGWGGALLITLATSCSGTVAVPAPAAELALEQAVRAQAGAEGVEPLVQWLTDGVVVAAWKGGVPADGARFLAGQAGVPRDAFEEALRRFAVEQGAAAQQDVEKVGRRIGKDLTNQLDDPGPAGISAALIAAMIDGRAVRVATLVPDGSVIDRAAVRRHLAEGGVFDSVVWSMRIMAWGWAFTLATIALGFVGIVVLLSRPSPDADAIA